MSVYSVTAIDIREIRILNGYPQGGAAGGASAFYAEKKSVGGGSAQGLAENGNFIRNSPAQDPRPQICQGTDFRHPYWGLRQTNRLQMRFLPFAQDPGDLFQKHTKTVFEAKANILKHGQSNMQGRPAHKGTWHVQITGKVPKITHPGAHTYMP